MKVNITLDDALMARIDGYAKENYMSRSGFVGLACAQYLNNADATRAITDMALAMRKIADTGIIDEETQRQLEDFERFARYLSSNK